MMGPIRGMPFVPLTESELSTWKEKQEGEKIAEEKERLRLLARDKSKKKTGKRKPAKNAAGE